jgi:hypothetical protein
MNDDIRDHRSSTSLRGGPLDSFGFGRRSRILRFSRLGACAPRPGILLSTTVRVELSR